MPGATPAACRRCEFALASSNDCARYIDRGIGIMMGTTQLMHAEPGQLHERKAEFTLLEEEILAFCSLRPSAHSCRIIGISGYGGVGKSYLLDSVLREVKGSLK